MDCNSDDLLSLGRQSRCSGRRSYSGVGSGSGLVSCNAITITNTIIKINQNNTHNVIAIVVAMLAHACWELRQGSAVIRLQTTIFGLDVVERLRSLHTHRRVDAGRQHIRLSATHTVAVRTMQPFHLILPFNNAYRQV